MTSSRELGVELTPDIAEALYIALVTDTGRFQYTNTTPKALRLAAELVEAGADVHRVFQGVYESVQFAKLKLLARALERAQVSRGRADSRLVSPAHGLRGSRRRRALLGGDHRLPARSRRSRHGRAHPRASAAGRPGAPRQPPCKRRRARRLRDRAEVGRRGSPAGGRASRARRRSRRSRSSCAGSSLPPRALNPSGIVLVDKPAGPSSFAIVTDLRRQTGARTGHAGTLDPFATGLLLLVVRCGN